MLNTFSSAFGKLVIVFFSISSDLPCWTFLCCSSHPHCIRSYFLTISKIFYVHLTANMQNILFKLEITAITEPSAFFVFALLSFICITPRPEYSSLPTVVVQTKPCPVDQCFNIIVLLQQIKNISFQIDWRLDSLATCPGQILAHSPDAFWDKLLPQSCKNGIN